MTTTVYTKSGSIQHIISDGKCILPDESNRDFRKIMAQDAITPFERSEIIEPEPDTTPSLQDQINTLAYLMGV